jgi:hypothetical protein
MTFTINAEQVQTWNKALSQFGVVVQASQAIHMSPVASVSLASLGLIASMMIFLDLGAHFLCNVVGFVIPAHLTYQILDQKADIDAHRACLTYWLVFALFSMFEGWMDSFFFWIPMYTYMRIALQSWLIMKNFAGADLVYKSGVNIVMSKVATAIALVTKDSITHRVPEAKKD